MSKRLVLVLCLLMSMGACAAFDSDNTPFVGFAPNEVPVLPGGAIGIYNGYYSGTMTLEFNDCEGVFDAVGDEMPFVLDVVHHGNVVNLVFEDGSVASGELIGTNAVFMRVAGNTEHVYYLDFSIEDSIVGSSEVIEATEEGVFGKPCASYEISMVRTEKPLQEDSAEEALE